MTCLLQSVLPCTISSLAVHKTCSWRQEGHFQVPAASPALARALTLSG